MSKCVFFLTPSSHTPLPETPQHSPGPTGIHPEDLVRSSDLKKAGVTCRWPESRQITVEDVPCPNGLRQTWTQEPAQLLTS